MADEQVLKCTQCGYELRITAAPEPLEGTEGRGTKDTCPVCGGRMKPRKK